tara:strand:- start:834 stop:1289 length:456 start_codon:yes stop_codon:yes gene_type:complete
MKSTLALCVVLGLLSTISTYADQLAYISKADAERAAEHIQDQQLIITYCSLCDNEPVELWHVQETKVAHTGYENYFEVIVKARRILTSARVFNSGEYTEPVELDYVGHPESALEELKLDLAYVYTASDGAWLCVGKLLEMDCEILVEKIRL